MHHPSVPGVEISIEWKILEVGSGPNQLLHQSTTLDVNPACKPDVCHDLNLRPYPFADNTFDLVICLHVLEHVVQLVDAITEIHRILKPGGLLFVEVPYFSSAHFFTDPTHVHAFSSRSFDYFDSDSPLSKFDYSNARFSKERVEIVVPGDGLVNRLIRRLINDHIRVYEERFAFIYPRHTLQFLLRAGKLAQTF